MTARLLGTALAVVLLTAGTALGAEDRWIVAADPGPQATAVARASGADRVDPVLGLWTAPRPVARRLAARLRARGLLRFAEPDRRLVPQQAVPADVTAGAWWRPKLLGTAGEVPVGAAGPAAAPVAVIESGGIDPTVADIPPSVTVRRAAASPFDATHGTAVVSVIAGRGPRVLGLNPGSDVRVYQNTGLCSDTAAAIRQAVRDGAKVVSMSYGFAGPGVCLAHEVATSYAAAFAVVVASAGNERAQPWMQPANDLHVLTVAALNAVDQPTGFTHQSVSTDVSAPGEAIGVACPVGGDTEDGRPDGFCTTSGTSFSAPMVAAVAARVTAARPKLSPAQVQRVLMESAADLGRPGYDIATGYGRVDLAKALTAPAPAVDWLEPNDDIAWVDGRHFRPDRPLLRTDRQARFGASLDLLKDPVDTYPVWVGPGERMRVTVRAGTAGIRVAIHQPYARTILAPADRITGRLLARPGRSVTLWAANPGSRGRKVWVSLTIARSRAYYTEYGITLRR